MKKKLIEKVNFEKTDWTKIQKGYIDYASIMQNMQNFDDEFKGSFAHFYRLNQGIKNSNNKNSFFNLLEECINKKQDDYATVLNRLSDLTGRNEMSFASKIVATVNPNKPIIDKIVLGHFKTNRPSYGDLKHRISVSINIYNEIEEEYHEFLKSKKGKELINDYNKNIKQEHNFNITNIKKIDFILWQTRN